VRLLLESGADTGMVNDTWLDGWELAARMKRPKVVAL
jgi:hypothetical protein